jgi:hypothetical protein
MKRRHTHPRSSVTRIYASLGIVSFAPEFAGQRRAQWIAGNV